MSEVILVAGLARNRAIGRNNQLLWHLPEDLKRFKALTLGHPVIMGRKTWDSLPERFRPLPGRRNIVLSRSALHLEGAEVLHSLTQAFDACVDAEKVFVIGGAQIYAEALPHASRLELTEIDADYPDADCFFPAWDSTAFTEIQREVKQGADWRYDFASYQRK